MLVLHDESESSDTFAMTFSFPARFSGLLACLEGGPVTQYMEVLCLLVCLSCRPQRLTETEVAQEISVLSILQQAGMGTVPRKWLLSWARVMRT